MSGNALPLLADKIPLTFSATKHIGFLSSSIRHISKNKRPFSSLYPSLGGFWATIENDWHGKPPIRMWCGGISKDAVFLMSLFAHFVSKLTLKISQAYWSLSSPYTISTGFLEYLLPRNSKPPSMPRSIPPQPANSETIFSLPIATTPPIHRTTPKM